MFLCLFPFCCTSLPCCFLILPVTLFSLFLPITLLLFYLFPQKLVPFLLLFCYIIRSQFVAKIFCIYSYFDFFSGTCNSKNSISVYINSNNIIIFFSIIRFWFSAPFTHLFLCFL